MKINKSVRTGPILLNHNLIMNAQSFEEIELYLSKRFKELVRTKTTNRYFIWEQTIKKYHPTIHGTYYKLLNNQAEPLHKKLIEHLLKTSNREGSRFGVSKITEKDKKYPLIRNKLHKAIGDDKIIKEYSIELKVLNKKVVWSEAHPYQKYIILVIEGEQDIYFTYRNTKASGTIDSSFKYAYKLSNLIQPTFL